MNKVPDLKFAGFSGEWESSRLSDISIINPKSGKLPETFKYVDLASVTGTCITNYTILNKEDAPSRAQRLSEKGDIFYQTVRPYQRNNYLFNLDDNDYVFSTGYAQIRTNQEPSFIFAIMQTNKFVNTVMNRTTGTSFPAISTTDLSNIDIKITPNKEEQKKIGDLFKKIDALIEIQEDKVSKMDDFKKSMLQKMFPKKDELVPEFSFDGFEGDWDKKQIVDIAEIVGGGTPSTNNTEYWKGDINWFSPSEIGDKIFYNSSLQKITELGLSKSSAKLLPKDNTILFTSRATLGNLGLITEDASTNQGFQNFILKNNIDKYLMYSYLQLLKNEFIKLSTGSTFKEISKKSIESIYIKIPIFEEQEK